MVTAQNALPLTAKLDSYPLSQSRYEVGRRARCTCRYFFVCFGNTHNFQLFFSILILRTAPSNSDLPSCALQNSQRRRHDIQLHQRGAHQRQQNQDEKEAFYRTESQAVPCERAHSQRVNVGCQPHGECNVGRRHSLSGLFMLLF